MGSLIAGKDSSGDDKNIHGLSFIHYRLYLLGYYGYHTLLATHEKQFITMPSPCGLYMSGLQHMVRGWCHYPAQYPDRIQRIVKKVINVDYLNLPYGTLVFLSGWFINLYWYWRFCSHFLRQYWKCYQFWDQTQEKQDRCETVFGNQFFHINLK